MEKDQVVYDWLNARFEAENDRAFTAGECARSAGVSVNTAKKWLQRVVEVEWSPLSSWSQDMANGKTVTLFGFNDKARASWR